MALIGQSSTKEYVDSPKGYKFTNNNTTLFLPAVGYIGNKEFGYVDFSGNYWVNLAVPTTKAYSFYFDRSNVEVVDIYYRFVGFAIRPARLELVTP